MATVVRPSFEERAATELALERCLAGRWPPRYYPLAIAGKFSVSSGSRYGVVALRAGFLPPLDPEAVTPNLALSSSSFRAPYHIPSGSPGALLAFKDGDCMLPFMTAGPRLLLVPFFSHVDGATSVEYWTPLPWPTPAGDLVVTVNGRPVLTPERCSTRRHCARSFAPLDVTADALRAAVGCSGDGRQAASPSSSLVMPPSGVACSVVLADPELEWYPTFALIWAYENSMERQVDDIRRRCALQASQQPPLPAAVAASVEAPLLPSCPEGASCRRRLTAPHKLEFRHPCLNLPCCRWGHDTEHLRRCVHAPGQLVIPSGGNTPPERKRRRAEVGRSGAAVPGSSSDDDDDDDGWGQEEPDGSSGDETAGLVEVGSVEVSLRCPLSYARITIPVRGAQCSHEQCFDLETYLKQCETLCAWNCPVCDHPLYSSDLVIDRHMADVLGQLEGVGVEECDRVRLLQHGRWERVTDDEKRAAAARPADARRCANQRALLSSSAPPSQQPTVVQKTPLVVKKVLPVCHQHAGRNSVLVQPTTSAPHAPSTLAAKPPQQYPSVPPVNDVIVLDDD